MLFCAPGDKPTLIDLILRVQEQADVPALSALCREMALRLLETKTRKLDWHEEGILRAFAKLPLRPLLPPGPSLPLSRLQSRLIGMLEAAGEDGVLAATAAYELFSCCRDADNNLRQLIHQTNRKLRLFDPHRRRIKRIRKKTLILKMLAKS